MTDFIKANAKKQFSTKIKSGLIIIPSLLLLFISVLFAPEISKHVNDGLRLCFNVIIGAVFPFMILTDIITATSSFEKINWLRRLFQAAFKINGCAVSAFIVGIFCGFPLGVKVSVDLYKSGYISKEECERLIGFSNNSGPAFIISGIGAGMRGSITDGVILYVSMVISSIICGLILSRNKSPSYHKFNLTDMSYSFSKSVKSSSLNTLYVCGFIIFFSIVCGTLKSLIANELLFSLIIPFVEISNSAKALSVSTTISRSGQMLLTSFAVSFSGISVHMQAKSFIIGTDILMKKYYSTKLLQGVIASFITLILVNI